MNSYISDYSNMKRKICYVLPRYESDDHTHFAHLHDFIAKIVQQADVFLIVESDGANLEKLIAETLGAKKVYVQRMKFTPLKCLENFFILLKARIMGYKNFYVHYSFMSALNASFIVRILGGKTFYWNCGLPWKYERNFGRDFFERLTYRMISYLVTGTNSLAEGYAKRYNIGLKKIKIMPNWISLERFAVGPNGVWAMEKNLGILSNDKVLLFIHRLSERKGAHFLLDIFQKIKKQDKKLIVIGDGPERGNLESKIRNLGLQDRVKLLGWVPNRELPVYYALADVFLMPSEEEGFPRVLLETMAMGVPFVAFDVGGVKEIVPEEFYQFILPAGDTDAFAAAANKILNWSDPPTGGERANWQKTAREWIGQYDTKAVAEKFLNMF